MEILLAVIAALGILTGIINRGEDKIITVVQHKTTVITPPEEMLKGCELPTPPDIDTYLDSLPSEKERILFASLTEHQKSIILCNVRFSNIRQWKLNQEKAAEESDKALPK